MQETSDNLSARLSPVFPFIAVVAAIVGLGDAVYLTVHHYTQEAVPCSLITGCETVLTSAYAEIFGVPLALFGAAAYFAAFSLALLAAFGNRRLWFAFGLISALMFGFTLWLIYLQGFVIEAFCQFCLLSAITSTTLFIVALVSRFRRFR